MEKQPDKQISELLSKRLLSLIAIILGFILLLVVIWLWYNIKITRLERTEKDPSGLLILPTLKHQLNYDHNIYQNFYPHA